jgi:MYXO-CTERM domain-containing protein
VSRRPLGERLGAAALLGLLSVAPNARAAAPPADCSRTSRGADEHTCVHGAGGPFASRAALPYPHHGSALEVENVDTPHTLFTLLLSSASGSTQWLVTYKPSTAGTYAFYLDLPGNAPLEQQPYPLELRDAFGQAVPLRLEHAVTSCPGALSWVRVYALEPARYQVVLGGAPGDNVQLAVEHLEGFPQNLYVDADGDGYGAGRPLSSWCGAARGYAVRDGDCDDDDAREFPDERGTCVPAPAPCDEGPAEGCPSGDGGRGDGAAGAGGESSAEGGAPHAAPPSDGGDRHSPPGGDSASAAAGQSFAGAAGVSLEPKRPRKASDGEGGCACRARGPAPPAEAAGPLVALAALLRRRQRSHR